MRTLCGQAIDQRDLPYALKRAAGVEIRVRRAEREADTQTEQGKYWSNFSHDWNIHGMEQETGVDA